MPTVGSKSLNGIQGSTFEVRLEYNKDYVILHLPRIDKFTVDTYKEMVLLLEDWYNFFRTVGYDCIYAAVDPYNSKIIRLLSKLGFKGVGSNMGMSIFKYTGD